MQNLIPSINKHSWRSLARHHDLLLALLVVSVIALMVLPLPPILLDTLIALNLTISIVLLMVAMYIGSPLGLSTFPSLLLFTTLFRLALNIASTRQILMHAYAGDIILTFGNMVVGGDIIVGLVVFLIIAVVQFIVIAKGSERVAEVGARFSLDAMPGKQMSIDADLRAGIIDKDEARQRRSRLERESQLYGAMDGAMKFVKGDAIAGIIIAAVNILAGIAIGTLRKGMDMGTALSTYSVLTVGDALVSQIPSLFVSIAAGIIITRVSDSESGRAVNLGNEIAEQVRAHPKALLIGAAIVFGMLFVPGFPKLQFFGLALLVGAVGYSLLPGKRRYASPGETPMPVMQRQGTDKTPPMLDATEHALTVPVIVQGFAGIENVLAPDRLAPELAKVRRYLAFDLGVPFPGMVMRTAERFAPGAYTIYVHEIPVESGEVRPGHLLALDDEQDLTRARIEYKNGGAPMFGRPPLWVQDKWRAQLDQHKRRYWTCEQSFAQHLLKVLRRHADEFVGIQETQLLLKLLAEQYPELEKELLRNVPLPRLTEVLKRLVREEISVRNLRDIAHSLIEWGPKEKDTVLVTEYVRASLARYISYRFSDGAGSVSAIVLHPKVEEQLRQAIRPTSAGTMLMLDPETSKRLTERLKETILPQLQNAAQRVALLTSLEIRPYLRKLTEIEFRSLPVLSYQELEPSTKVTAVATVNL